MRHHLSHSGNTSQRARKHREVDQRGPRVSLLYELAEDGDCFNNSDRLR